MFTNHKKTGAGAHVAKADTLLRRRYSASATSAPCYVRQGLMEENRP
jgi:hypothetical protein